MVTLRIGLTHKQVKTLISTSGPMSALWSNIRHLYKLCLCMYFVCFDLRRYTTLHTCILYREGKRLVEKSIIQIVHVLYGLATRNRVDPLNNEPASCKQKV